MKKFFANCLDVLLCIFGLDCKARRQAVDEGVCDYSGQGRNRYGK